MTTTFTPSTLFGDNLQAQSGTVSTNDALKDKVIGIYFSAHWCPPCRGFTPKLADTYKAMQADGKNFEIVFVSSDRDEESFNEYFGSMPWKAVPFLLRDEILALKTKFEVSGIPKLVILNTNGEMITDNGRAAIAKDPTGKNFPWVPPTFKDIMGTKIFKKNADATDVEEVDSEDLLKDKIIGLYFSAHWCPPCRAFTPKLSETYKLLQEQNKNFEVIFCSADRTESDYKDYYLKDMANWLTLGFNDERFDALSEKFGIQGYPTLILLNNTSSSTSKTDIEVITSDATTCIRLDAKCTNFPWYPQPIATLDWANGNTLNSKKCFIAFLKDDTYEKSLIQFATEHVQKQKAGEKDEINFFYDIGNKVEFGAKIRSLMKLKDESVVIFKFPSYYVLDGDITDASIASFVDDVENKKAEEKQLQ